MLRVPSLNPSRLRGVCWSGPAEARPKPVTVQRVVAVPRAIRAQVADGVVGNLGIVRAGGQAQVAARELFLQLVARQRGERAEERVAGGPRDRTANRTDPGPSPTVTVSPSAPRSRASPESAATAPGLVGSGSPIGCPFTSCAIAAVQRASSTCRSARLEVGQVVGHEDGVFLRWRLDARLVRPGRNTGSATPLVVGGLRPCRRASAKPPAPPAAAPTTSPLAASPPAASPPAPRKKPRRESPCAPSSGVLFVLPAITPSRPLLRAVARFSCSAWTAGRQCRAVGRTDRRACSSHTRPAAVGSL